jgi:ABC-2 type transport system ATP-binding protein
MDTTNRRSSVSTSDPHARPGEVWAGAPAIVAERLGKAGGTNVRALTGLSFCIGQGEFFGLIGPEGAGKTTLLRVLATLIQPDTGRLRVYGYDAQSEARQIRSLIGYVGQRCGVDKRLTGTENIHLMARLHGLSRQDAARRTEEMLSRLDLTTLGGCKAALFPPGALKRLAVACGLVHRPRLLLLDNPTDGMGQQDQAPLWQLLKSAHEEEDVAIFLATNHLDEAESMCQRVAIMDGGKIIASGTPTELKAQVTGVTITVKLSTASHSTMAIVLLDRITGVRAIWPHADLIEIEAAGASSVAAIVRLLEEHEIGVREITLSKPSLDEVFFRHTGRKMRDALDHTAAGTTVPGRR